MKLKMWIQIAAIGISAVALTACSSGHKKNSWAVNDSNQAYQDGAQASGLGDEDRLSDANEGEGTKSLAKRTYYFDFDSDVIRSDDRPAIDANAHKLAQSNSAKVMLEGHTSPEGSREYNIGLGERRAKSVAEAMAAKGVKPNQLRLVSYGAEKPATTGNSETDYQKDRRVVLVDLHGSSHDTSQE